MAFIYFISYKFYVIYYSKKTAWWVNTFLVLLINSYFLINQADQITINQLELMIHRNKFPRFSKVNKCWVCWFCQVNTVSSWRKLLQNKVFWADRVFCLSELWVLWFRRWFSVQLRCKLSRTTRSIESLIQVFVPNSRNCRWSWFHCFHGFWKKSGIESVFFRFYVKALF